MEGRASESPAVLCAEPKPDEQLSEPKQEGTPPVPVKKITGLIAGLLNKHQVLDEIEQE